ncbi:MAG: nucleotidyl transferase AbiEii/AbiGii toxin family protein [Planctomycetia bacterium]
MMHAEVLPPEQQACLRRLGPAVTAGGFHLIGGTAVAIHLGHRQSVDFDWCTQQFPGEPVNFSASLAGRGVRLSPTSLAQGTVHGSVDGVKVSFLEFKPPLLEPTLDWPEYGCRLAGLADLAAMKLLAVSQRGTKKDFIDVHALGGTMSLKAMIDAYCRRFSLTDVGRVLAALCYFDDADDEPMPTMLVPADWEAIKHALRHQVRAIA